MQLSLITAFDQQLLIGNGNALPWHIPEDLAYFKETTLNHIIVMGRKTYDSIGKPLPKRRNIVLSKNLQSIPGVEVMNEINTILELAKSSQVFIIGGAEIYKLFLPYATTLHITHIDDTFSGDTYFPAISWQEWQLQSEVHGISQRQQIPFKFCKYIKKID